MLTFYEAEMAGSRSNVAEKGISAVDSVGWLINIMAGTLISGQELFSMYAR